MIYLIHFEQPIGRAQHYLGTCRDTRIDERLREHARGDGASLTRTVVKRGISMWLARVFPELGRDDERRLKTAGHFRDFCPLCCPLLNALKSDQTLLAPHRLPEIPQRAIWDARGPLHFPEPEAKKKGPA